MNNDLITILLSNTFKKLLNIIIEWQNNNDISNNDYLSELYITNLNKIMSFDYNNKNNINIIKKKIYEIVSG